MAVDLAMPARRRLSRRPVFWPNLASFGQGPPWRGRSRQEGVATGGLSMWRRIRRLQYRRPRLTGRLRILCGYLITGGHGEPPATPDRPIHPAPYIYDPLYLGPCGFGCGRYPSISRGHSTESKRSPRLDSLGGKHVTAQHLASHDLPVVIVGKLVEHLVSGVVASGRREAC